MSIVSPLRLSLSRLTFALFAVLVMVPWALRAQSNSPSSADGFDPNVNGIVYAMALQPDGKVLVAGKFTSVQPNGTGTGTTRNNLARFNADGSLDTAFNADVNNQINALILQPDGKIVIGGLFTSVNSSARGCLARLNADGSLDSSLNQAFANQPSPAVNALALQADGKIVVGGAFTALVPAGAATAIVRNRVARFNADGSLDTGFNPNANGTVYSLAVQADGKVVVGGFFTSVQPSASAVTRNRIARFNANGSLDEGFDPNADASVMALAIQADGAILLGGFFSTLAPNGTDPVISRSRMARLKLDGSLDTAFNPRPTSNVTAIAVQADGDILVGGLFTNIAGVTRSSCARLLPSGLFDPSFDAGLNANQVVNAFAVQPDGKIIIGGNFIQLLTAGGLAVTRNHVARLNVDGTPDVNFDPNLSGRIGVLELQPDGKVIFGGSFSSVGGLARNNLARSNADGTIDAGFNPDVSGTVGSLAVQADGKILVGGNFFSVGGTPRGNIARLNADGSVDAGFDPNANGAVTAIAVQSDGKILLGGFFGGLQPNGSTTVTARGNLVRLNADGTVDTSFTPLFNGEILALKVLSDGRIMAAGNFIALQANGGLFPNTQSFIVRMNSAGVVDRTFSAAPDNKIETMAIQGDGKIVVGGTFAQFQPNFLVAPTVRRRIARLNTDGAVDTTFDPSANGEVRTVAVQADGKILLGGSFFTLKPNGTTNATARSYVARVNSDGTLDADFDARAGSSVNAIAVQADGKILLGGAFTVLQPNGSPNVAPRTHLARLNSNGTLDNAYDPAFANAPGNLVKALALQSDGNIILGGFFGKIAGSTGDNLVRFKSDGSLDTTFNPGANGPVNAIGVQTNKGAIVTQGNGFAWLNSDGLPRTAFSPSSNVKVIGEVNVVASQPDGSVLLGGSFTNLTGATAGNLIRLKSNGTLDTSFNPAPNGRVNAIVVQSDGKILLGGGFTSLQPNGTDTAIARNRIARLNADGTVDSGFDPNASEQVNALLIQPDGKIVVAGAFTTLQPNGASTAVTVGRLARLNADGTLDASFGTGANDQVLTLALQSDGKILVGGTFNVLQTVARNRIGRLNSDGTLDTGFDPNANGVVVSIKLQSDGLIVIGGGFSMVGGWVRTGLSRLLPNGGNDPTFDVAINGVLNSVAIQPNNQLLIGGSFNSVAGTTRNNLARINSNATLDTSFDPNVDGQVDVLLVQSDGSMLVAGLFTSLKPYGVIMVGGSFSQVSGTAARNLALLNEDGNANGTFQPNPNDVVNAIVVQPDGKVLVGGAFTTMAGVTRNRLARFNADSTLDTSFNPNAGDQVYAMALQPDGRILVGGAFASVGGGARSRLARLNSDGSLDGTFNPGANDTVYSLAVQSSGSVVVGGAFTSVGGASRNRLARLGADGSVDGSFNPNANDKVNAISLQADGQVIVAGAFTAIGGTARNRLARINANGSLDGAFDPAADGEVSALVLQPDGKLVIGGAFARVGGQARYRFARLSALSAATQSITTSSDVSSLTWTRGGTSPELAWVTFEQSLDGETWTTVGQAGRAASGAWQLGTSALPKTTTFLVRARGALPSSQYSSSGLIETVQRIYPALALSGASTDATATSSGSVKFSADGLPSGLLVDPVTGIIYGEPAAPGTYKVALNAIGSSGTRTVTQTFVYGAAAAGARSRPVNTSTRAFVSDGHPLFVGFIIMGTEPKTVLLRGIGPGLTAYKIPGVLAVPHLRLYNNDTGQLLLQNDGWGSNSALVAAFDRIGAFPLPTGSADAAMVATLQPGAYTIQILASPGASGVALAEVYDASTSQSTETAWFGNVSARGPSTGADNPLIAGFVIGGSASKRLLVRGIGPGLLGYGVADALTDPVVGVYDADGRLVAQNDNWGTPLTVNPAQLAVSGSVLADAAAAAGGFALAPGSKDAVLIVNLPPGLYTVQVSGVNFTTGSALAEVYELP